MSNRVIFYTEKQIKRIMNDETKRLHLAAHVLINDIKTSFTGSKWKPRVPSTKERKKRSKNKNKTIQNNLSRKKKSRIGHVPSKPGQPPAVFTGALRRSITYNVVVVGHNIILRVGTNIKYARRLEWGFIGRDKLGRNVRQLPRPWLYPAYRRQKDKIIKLLSG